MLIILLSLVLASLAMAQGDCVAVDPPLNLPTCMDSCFSTNFCTSCPCPTNLKGWCEIFGGEGPDSWFARWSFCVVGKCPDDGDIHDLMGNFTEQCEGTVGGPLTKDTVPLPLRDWMPKDKVRGTATSVVTLSASAATLIRIISTETTMTGSTPVSAETTAPTMDSAVTVLDDKASSSSSRATNSSAPTIGTDSTLALNVAAIIGIAVGGTILLVLIVGLIAFFLRHRKRRELPRAESPPVYEPTDRKNGHEKPELDGQALGYQCSKVDASVHGSAPVVYVELDDMGHVSLVGELAGHRGPPRSCEK